MRTLPMMFEGACSSLLLSRGFRSVQSSQNSRPQMFCQPKSMQGWYTNRKSYQCLLRWRPTRFFIPKNSNFPAIDLILKDDKDVWVIQAHVADHDDVEPTFRKMCDEQGWFDSFDNIYLVYLSPSPSVKESLTCLPVTPTRTKKPRLSKVPKPEIQVSAMTIDDFECLCDIHWPSTAEDVSMVDA